MFLKKSLVIILVVLFFSFLTMGMVGEDNVLRFYSVKIGPFPGDAQRNHAKSDLAGKNVLDIGNLETKDGAFLVIYVFGNYPEASYFSWKCMETYGINSTVKETLPDEKTANRQPPFHSHPFPFFSLPVAHISEMPDINIPENDQVTQRASAFIAQDKRKEARIELDKIINNTDNTDCRKGWALTRKGIIDLLEKNYDTALDSLAPAAQGRVAIPREQQIKAMRRVAWILHQQKKMAEAYQAYRELEDFSGSDLVKAIARVEQCGIIMELARSEKGTLGDARRAFSQALDDVTPDCKRQRGTLELMNLETYYYEENYEKCADLAEKWLEKYDDQLRDKSMCLMFYGFSLNKLGNFEKSALILETIIALPDPEDSWDKFASGNQKAKACYWLAEFAERRGETERQLFWNEEAKKYTGK